MTSMRFCKAVCGMLLLLGAANAATATHFATFRLRDGLPYVTVQMLGCGECPELMLLLDTGASTSIIPFKHIVLLRKQHRALEAGEAIIVFADHESATVKSFLVDGLVIAGCEIHRVQVITSGEPSEGLVPLIGMDLLQRLGDVSISIHDEEQGTLSFTCPQRHLQEDSCSWD